MIPVPKLSLSQQMASRAEAIVNNLEQTDYQYREQIDPASGVYDCDCNAFVGFILEGLAPDAYAQVPKEATQPRPRAFEYYVFFSSLGSEPVDSWQQISLLDDLRRGDIIAWRTPEVEVGHDTGHVMIAAGRPEALGGGIFAVRIYDSAALPHFEDTRGPVERQFANGVGSGFINLKVDDSGKALSFQFAPPETSPFVELPIAIGRLLSSSAPDARA